MSYSHDVNAPAGLSAKRRCPPTAAKRGLLRGPLSRQPPSTPPPHRDAQHASPMVSQPSCGIGRTRNEPHCTSPCLPMKARLATTEQPPHAAAGNSESRNQLFLASMCNNGAWLMFSQAATSCVAQKSQGDGVQDKLAFSVGTSCSLPAPLLAADRVKKASLGEQSIFLCIKREHPWRENRSSRTQDMRCLPRALDCEPRNSTSFEDREELPAGASRLGVRTCWVIATQEITTRWPPAW